MDGIPDQMTADTDSATFTDVKFHESIISDPTRLLALHQGDLLDKSRNPTFDKAVRIATRLLGAPVGMVSFVDGDRQFFKSSVGLDAQTTETQETPLTHSFCQYVVSSDTALSVSDARLHPHLKNNGAIADLGVIAYLGVPVHGRNGETLGSFCTIDTKPREWTADEREVLEDLSGMLEVEIALRSALDDRQLLLQEMNHRVKNIFALVSGIVRMNARSETNVEDFAETLDKRFHALTRAHDLIVPMVNAQNNAGSTISLSMLLDTLMAPYATAQGGKFQITGDDIKLGPNATTNFALAIHETVTNCSKYGALSFEEGDVSISWSDIDDEVHFIWHETHLPTKPETAGPAGFGTRLINMTIERQMGGRVQTETTDTSYLRRFVVPLKNILA